VAVVAGGACGGSSDESPPTKSAGCVHLADGQCVTETFHNPPTLEPDGDGVYHLDFGPTEFEVDGKRRCGRGYNGLYPGPTIDTPAQKDGKARQIRVDLRNEFSKHDPKTLEDADCTCTDGNGASCEPNHDDTNSTCACVDADGKECHVFDFNITNLHAHGSHVRPNFAAGEGCTETGNMQCRSCTDDRDAGDHECFFADDVLARVHPGQGTQNRWDIDEDGVHHAGLDWYHPHIHGSTAIQVEGGAAGAWIVRGPLDEIPGIAKAKERVLVLTTPPTDFTPLADGEACDEDHITDDDFTVISSSSANETNLINGLRRPRMIMPPGQIERWRILSASFLDETTLALFKGKDSSCSSLDLAAGPIPLTQIGRDGLPLPRPKDGADWPFAPPYMFLSTGYRVEALLDGSKLKHGDTLCLMSARYLQDKTTEPKPPTPTAEGILQAITNGDVVAIVNVTNDAGPPTETRMPDLAKVAEEAPPLTLQDGAVDGLARCKEVQAITDPEQIDQLAAMWLLFYNTDELDECGFPDHNINCKNFETTDRDKYPFDRVMEKGSVDHWRLVAGFDGHPFHIHINPYLVCPLPPAGSNEPNTKSRLFEPPFAHWRDTYLVNLDRSVDALTEYRFTGSYVYHCHKLTHEDHGMMELLHVCDPKEESCDTLCSGGPCTWKTCLPDDEDCERRLVATECALDPKKCPEAVLRCTECGSGMSCPPDAHCGSDTSSDGKNRCVPGCTADGDCAATEVCSSGECQTAPPCSPPCGPGSMCAHGACQ
jgi:FtsP/CotA-like multicopper oxidase with cupredoxin domain